MRVYEHGYLETEFKVTCPKCECAFIYRPKDVKEHIEYDFETMTGVAYRYAVCPECHTEYVYTDLEERTYNDVLQGTLASAQEETDDSYDGGDIDENDGGDIDG